MLPTSLSGQTSSQTNAQQTETPDNIRQSVVQVFTFESFPNEPYSESPSGLANPIAHGFGIVIQQDGKILTNRHLLADPETCQYRVQMNGSKELLEAKLLAADSWIDLAVLSITSHEGQSFSADRIEFSEAERFEFGIKKRLLKSGETLTIYPAENISAVDSGIVESYPVVKSENRNQRLDSLAFDSQYQYGGLIRIRTNRPGFKSGAGVFNSDGKLVAITTALTPNRSDINDTVAIELTDAIWRRVQVMVSGRLPEYRFAGLTLRELSADQRQQVGVEGVQVTDIVTHAPAWESLQFSDVITHVNGTAIQHANQFWSLINLWTDTEPVQIDLIRGALSNGSSRNISCSFRLAKGRTDTRRKSWQSAPGHSWRGLSVEDPFAMPKYQTLLPTIKFRECVVASHVRIDSAAWQAGLRPRHVIRKLDGKIATDPATFYRIANKSDSGDVILTIADSKTGDEKTLAVGQPD